MSLTRKLLIPDEVRTHRHYPQFVLYDNEHPEVMRNIIKQLQIAKAIGRKSASVRDIMSALRWSLYIDLGDKTYKINNNYSSLYTRIIKANYPDLSDMLTVKSLTSAS